MSPAGPTYWLPGASAVQAMALMRSPLAVSSTPPPDPGVHVVFSQQPGIKPQFLPFTFGHTHVAFHPSAPGPPSDQGGTASDQPIEEVPCRLPPRCFSLCCSGLNCPVLLLPQMGNTRLSCSHSHTSLFPDPISPS